MESVMTLATKKATAESELVPSVATTAVLEWCMQRQRTVCGRKF